jgi:NADH-quinone oxidoreductase subunit F
MDLRIPKSRPSLSERRAIDAVLGPATSGWAGGRRSIHREGRIARGGKEGRSRRDLLLPALQAAQGRAGWISEPALHYICRRLTVPPAEAYGVASFYGMLTLEKRAENVVHVCDDIVCRFQGGEDLCRSLEKSLGRENQPRGRTWLRSPCLGLCEQAPAALFTRAGETPAEGGLGHASLEAVLLGLETGLPPAPELLVPQKGEPGLKLLARIGRTDPGNLDDYRAFGGYEALRRALSLGPDGVIREVLDAKLVGRGGAAFPTGKKWEAVGKSAIHPHYLVCNADESEPGTFKDRVVMEGDPFAVVESMTIAAYAAGVERGYLYIRGEYPLAHARLEGAISAARARGLLGSNIMGHPFSFDIELRRGAGAYICGEETALFNSIEGFRGEPRNKPPFPTVSGLFHKPTLVNNVETLVNVLPILREGGPSYARIGTPGSTGTKLFCLSGTIRLPGVYEVPFGMTLAALLERAGGMRDGKTLRAVLLGGAAGGFLTPDEIQVPLTFEGVRAIGASLGSGVVLVLDDSVDLWDTLLRIAAFFRDESCGQCVPCRVGTVRQEEALVRLSKAKAGSEAVLLKEIAQVMRDASICGLGQTAASAVQSALSKFDLGRGAS